MLECLAPGCNREAADGGSFCVPHLEAYLNHLKLNDQADRLARAAAIQSETGRNSVLKQLGRETVVPAPTAATPASSTPAPRLPKSDAKVTTYVSAPVVSTSWNPSGEPPSGEVLKAIPAELLTPCARCGEGKAGGRYICRECSLFLLQKFRNTSELNELGLLDGNAFLEKLSVRGSAQALLEALSAAEDRKREAPPVRTSQISNVPVGMHPQRSEPVSPATAPAPASVRKRGPIAGFVLAGCLVAGLAAGVAAGGDLDGSLGTKLRTIINGTGTIKGQIFIVTKGKQNFPLALVAVRMIRANALKDFISKRQASLQPRIEAEQQAVAAGEKKLEELEASAKGERWEIPEAPKMPYVGGAEGLIPNMEQYDLASSEYNRRSSEVRAHNNEVEERYEPLRKDARAQLSKNRAELATLSSAEQYFEGLPAAAATATSDSRGDFQFTASCRESFVLVARSSRDVFGDVEKYYWMQPVLLESETKQVMLSNDNLLTVDDISALIHVL